MNYYKKIMAASVFWGIWIFLMCGCAKEPAESEPATNPLIINAVVQTTAGEPITEKESVAEPAETETPAAEESAGEPETIEAEITSEEETFTEEAEPVTEETSAEEPEIIEEPIIIEEPTIIEETTVEEIPSKEETTEEETEALQPESGWRITQYGSDEENQRNCYAIVDEANRLILIDGGYDYNADSIRQIIAQHNNHVDAWIISHPHPDHAGAVNVILENPDGITIDRIYTVEVNGGRYRETAAEYDRIDVYEKFLALTENFPDLIYIKENDEWELLGLHFKALHAWNVEVDDMDDHLCNNGSMMFVVSGQEEKMLFCSDVQSQMQGYVIGRHVEELDVDYVQLGHHGSGGLTPFFYEYTSPKAVFFDAPSWLMNRNDNIYSAYMLREYFLQKGVEIYAFDTAPNTIILH